MDGCRARATRRVGGRGVGGAAGLVAPSRDASAWADVQDRGSLPGSGLGDGSPRLAHHLWRRPRAGCGYKAHARFHGPVAACKARPGQRGQGRSNARLRVDGDARRLLCGGAEGNSRLADGGVWTAARWIVGQRFPTRAGARLFKENQFSEPIATMPWTEPLAYVVGIGAVILTAVKARLEAEMGSGRWWRSRF